MLRISFQFRKLTAAILCLAAAIIIGIFFSRIHSRAEYFAGGSLLSPPDFSILAASISNQIEESERFQRPSKDLPYPNPYTFSDFIKSEPSFPLVTESFASAKEVILAYYGILKDASNMLGYTGGCGTIGSAKQPYPYVYELFTKEAKEKMTLNQFIGSLEGIGHMTLLKLVPVYAPPGTPSNEKSYMVELEVITGRKKTAETDGCWKSLFAYYYGVATAEHTEENGWKIKNIQYIPQDFLCAPMHSWFYLSEAVVSIVYGDNLKRIDRIDRTEQRGDMIYQYASGNGNFYRFDFIRLTNGYDILLHENQLENGSWVETSLLTEPWDDLKLTSSSFLKK